jgi:pimeloyl-ACP methyl ester carboxylesterase
MKNHISKPVESRLSFLPHSIRLTISFFLLTGLFVISSCSDDDPDPIQRDVLVDATPVLTRTANELKTYIGASPIDLDASAIKYDVELFKVTYKTTYKGEVINASGLVILPKTSDEVGMVSFQHGTIAAKSEAPTALPISNGSLILYAALSSAGFITVVPDFIGFGASADKFHPYYVEEATADAVIDNLKAAREWALEKKINFNDRLFLAGYSQGGYATMAAHKRIEEDGLDNFDLIASFPASGGYDVKEMQEYFFSQFLYDEPYYMAYVALSYQSYYDWDDQSLSDFFNEPYATNIPSLFNGTNGAGTINAQLTDNITELIQEDLISNIDTDPQYAYLVNAFEENSLTDWTPTIPMYMYHGDADTTVPYENSVSTYNQLLDNGASASVVTFTTLPGADHGSGVVPYIEDFIGKLLALR